jgi:hypothetical protein
MLDKAGFRLVDKEGLDPRMKRYRTYKNRAMDFQG